MAGFEQYEDYDGPGLAFLQELGADSGQLRIAFTEHAPNGAALADD